MDADDHKTRQESNSSQINPIQREEIAQQVFERYIDQLKALVRSRLNERIRRRVGISDVAQEAFNSLFNSTADINDPDGLWNLLATIARRKVCKVARMYKAQKRDAVEIELSTIEDLAAGPSPEEAIAVEEAMEVLTDEDQQFVSWKLEGWTHAEIAEKMGCSEKNVQRILRRIRTAWEQGTNEAAVPKRR